MVVLVNFLFCFFFLKNSPTQETYCNYIQYLISIFIIPRSSEGRKVKVSSPRRRTIQYRVEKIFHTFIYLHLPFKSHFDFLTLKIEKPTHDAILKK